MPIAKAKRLRVVGPNEGHVAPSVATAVASVSGTPDLHSKYQAIFDQASDAIMTILPDGVIDGANQAIEEMTGHLKAELVGNSVDMLTPPHTNKSAHHHGRPLTKEMLSSSGTYEDVVVARKDGYNRFVDLNVRSISSGASTLTLALLRDVTAKKQMERELITKHTELRNAYLQLEKKNAELQAMQETLVQSGKMAALGELAAGIAHELNQPLQGIRLRSRASIRRAPDRRQSRTRKRSRSESS
jgi:PAS domain S-box-containing protein